ncbi:hypothetical protein ACN42_g11419 [Penicillium freii]|uniref:Uncharacterized protein n=1 Tax=Penicillium freii TaxID=48697 RepID=A0A117NKB6_PENFR|nr:hypothetical protein ACN42_g11419 [Penicillium freii]
MVAGLQRSVSGARVSTNSSAFNIASSSIPRKSAYVSPRLFLNMPELVARFLCLCNSPVVKFKMYRAKH